MLMNLMLLAAVGSVQIIVEELDVNSVEYCDYINKKQNSWVARRNFPKNTTYNIFKRGFGVDPKALNKRLPERKTLHPVQLEPSFDARNKWSNCDTINDIRNQGQCEGCWAFAPTEVISDRICIHSNNNEVVRISPQELIGCCNTCAPEGGCNPGYPVESWKYWKKMGIVTGGDYNDIHTCLPFEEPPCGVSKICPYVPKNCTEKCQSNYKKHFDDDKYYGQEIYSICPDQFDIMREISVNGPVQAVMQIYYDYQCYRKGVYRHVDSRKVGAHAVKIIGWGEENGFPYWLISNSMGSNWGELGGFFKIARGSDECEIERHVHAGIPKQKTKST